MKNKPIFWKSLKTGMEYSYAEYCNHGRNEIITFDHKEYKDLPSDEYPYTIIFEEIVPLWKLNSAKYNNNI